MRLKAGRSGAMARAVPCVVAGHRAQRVARDAAAGAGVELRGVDILAARLDRHAPPRIGQPTQRLALDRHGEHQRDRAVFPRAIGQRGPGLYGRGTSGPSSHARLLQLDPEDFLRCAEVGLSAVASGSVK